MTDVHPIYLINHGFGKGTDPDHSLQICIFLKTEDISFLFSVLIYKMFFPFYMYQMFAHYKNRICDLWFTETISNNNLSSTGSLHVETWAIVLISVVVILLVILAIVVWFVHHRQSCRGPIVADYHAWQLHGISAIPAMGPDSQTSSPRDDTNIEPTPMIRRKDPSPIARIAPRHSGVHLDFPKRQNLSRTFSVY